MHSDSPRAPKLRSVRVSAKTDYALRAALELAERFISTDWEPDDYDRDLIQPVRAALAKEIKDA